MNRTRQMNRRVVLILLSCIAIGVLGGKEVLGIVKPVSKQNQNGATQTQSSPTGIPSGLQDHLRQSEYKKGEIIVKFKDSVSECVHCLLESKKPFAQATTDRSKSLDEFFKKHPIKSARLLFPQWHDRSIQSSKAKYQKAIESIKRKFPKRTARIPKNAKTPDLTHTYILEVAEDVDIPRLCQELQRDPPRAQQRKGGPGRASDRQ